MPSLANINSRIQRNTRYAVSADDIFAALDEAGFLIYTRVLKENEGFFLKTDETTVTLTPGTQEYDLPADCTQLAHVAEHANPSDPWFPMRPESLNAAMDNLADLAEGYLNVGLYGDSSSFSYYGPYLDQNDIANASPEADNSQQTMKMKVSPQIDVIRAVQLIYAAKWMPILDESSAMTLPEEGTRGLYNLAMAGLTAEMDDTRAGSYAQTAEQQIRGFLSWVRDRQFQQGPKVKTYLL